MKKTDKKGLLPLLLSLLVFIPSFLWSADYSRFGIIGDTKIGVTETVYGHFLKALENDGIDVIFITGDVIDKPGAEDEWRCFLKLTEEFTFHIAPGNHDINSPKSLKVYEEVIGKPPYYSFTEDDTLFVMLCTDLPGEITKITGRQLEWLRTELKRPFPIKIVFLHKPLFPFFGDGYDLDKYREDRDTLHDVFVENKVSAVFSGHEHLYHRREKDGITYVITGGGGSYLLTHREDFGGYFHYIIAKKDNGGYLFKVFDIKGSIRDQFLIKMR